MGTIARGSPLERSWTPEDAAELYQIDGWSQGYFAIRSDGHLVVRPEKDDQREIDVLEIIESLAQQGTTAPILLRFSNLLSHRLGALRDAFDTAIEANAYQGGYLAVYPIKVNQQRAVVEEVYRYGRAYGFGLEVGSKPELLAVMAMADDPGPRLILCNGFKDNDYIKTVTLAQKLGRDIVPVVEKLDELELILRNAEEQGLRPRLGVRVKLSSEGAGRWRGSSGVKSKFGLFVSEVIELAERLRSRGLEDCLELLHCHVGSQLHDIRRVKDAIGELTHIYAELVRMGAEGLRYLDVGGGLAVDYDGSKTNFPSSRNYSLSEYASEVVYRVTSVCNEKRIPHPTIVTESGRAIAAYQSLLIVNVVGRSGLDDFAVPEDLEEIGQAEIAQPVLDLIESHRQLEERRAVECYHGALQAYEQALNLFNLGYLSLTWRGFCERLFWTTCAAIYRLAQSMPSMPEELEELERILADIYFCNFSVFQSLPDSWAINQLFPIAPIHRLDEKPTRRGVLADMTCDSDGKIDRFVALRDIERTLPLHELRPGEEYYLGVFLTGAYQETLGDLHNLFGDTHVVHLSLGDEGQVVIDEAVAGDTAAEVLSYLQYDVNALRSRLRATTQRAVASGRLSEEEAQAIVDHYEAELKGYTYLEAEEIL